VELTAISWNLFHGRDFPPDSALFTWRSRLLKVTERNATHIQVNRDLVREFAGVLAAAEWDVALLQECPPRYCAPLARACGAEPHGVLTSRNSLGPLRGLAARLNPDLIASGEGGSNLTLIRAGSPAGSAVTSVPYRHINHHGTLGEIVERRELTIHEGGPERRAMAFTRTASRLCVANLHASAHDPDLAAEDVLRAATAATEWAGGKPLLFGGDLNLRPEESPAVFAELRERFGLAAPTGPRAIEQRELREGGWALRLSDHAPVEARFTTLGG
jgi:endonuclease/exonuclease/phosphatase family metal-dependent hydrolase